MHIFSFIKRHVFIATVAVLAVVVVAVIAGRAAQSSREAASAQVATTTTQVVLMNAASFRKGASDIAADGVIESRGQADLKSQTSAPVSIENLSIGDSVYSGQVILELQNSDIKAQLAQAQANLKLAQGQYYAGSVSLQSAEQGLVDKVKDAYIKGYDALNTDIDPVLYTNGGTGSQLSTLTADSNLLNTISNSRQDLTATMITWKAQIDAMAVSTSSINFIALTQQSETNLNSILSLSNLILGIINHASAGATPSSLATLAAVRAPISAAQSSISGASSALTAAASSFQTSNATQNSTAEAQISVAQAGVNNLEAQLEKTVIRSPISGKVAALPLEVGELASPGTLLATVIGETGLEVKAYASGDDFARLKLGLPVTIDGTIQGTLESVAPSVDPSTKKVEVVVNVSNSDQSNLVIGKHVPVSIHAAQATATSGDGKPAVYLLPIQDIKITPGKASVFTVDSNSKIVENDVILGNVQGDFIEVTSGLSDDMNLVTPVYELDPGQVVNIH